MGQKNILCGHVSHPLLEANFFLLPFSAKFLAREFCIQLFPLPNLPSAFFGNFYFYQSTVDLPLNYFSTLMLFNSLFLNTILKLLFCKVYTLSETSYETELSYFLHTYTLSLSLSLLLSSSTQYKYIRFFILSIFNYTILYTSFQTPT